jgi:hypothetical protein
MKNKLYDYEVYRLELCTIEVKAKTEEEAEEKIIKFINDAPVKGVRQTPYYTDGGFIEENMRLNRVRINETLEEIEDTYNNLSSSELDEATTKALEPILIRELVKA